MSAKSIFANPAFYIRQVIFTRFFHVTRALASHFLHTLAPSSPCAGAFSNRRYIHTIHEPPVSYRPAQLKRRGACLGVPAAQRGTFRARRGSAGDGPLPLREFTCTVARARLRCCAGDVGGVAGCACGSARLFWARFGGAGVGAGRRTAASCWRTCTGSLPSRGSPTFPR